MVRKRRRGSSSRTHSDQPAEVSDKAQRRRERRIHRQRRSAEPGRSRHCKMPFRDRVRKEASADEVLDSAITSLTQLRRDGETKGLVPISEVLMSSIKSINADVRHGDTARIKLGYPKLDAMLGGLGPGTIHILAARPSMGKTALAINMATNVAANQKTVVVFSLEMSNNEIGKRLLSSAMTKPVRDIVSSPSVSESDRQ